MNITISKINNGFIVAIATPKGQTATYVKTWDEVVAELQSLNDDTGNTIRFPVDGK